MRQLAPREFEQQAERFDRAALATPDIDHFCSSSAWVLPAYQAFAPDREPLLLELDQGYLAMAKNPDPRGFEVLEPLEPCWLLSTPLVGQMSLAWEALEQVARPPVAAVYLSGVAKGSVLERCLRGSSHFQVRPGPDTIRHVATLGESFDDFLSRRSSQFRSRLRRTRKKFFREGFTFQDSSHDGDPDRLFERILAVEHRSWKGHRRVGIDRGTMMWFYRRMLPRLQRTRRLRLLFLLRDGQDVAYVLGGVFGKTFRGLQFSYDQDFKEFGLGNVSQTLMVEQLIEEGVSLYDLGTDLAYKRRWADYQQITSTYILLTKW